MQPSRGVRGIRDGSIQTNERFRAPHPVRSASDCLLNTTAWNNGHTAVGSQRESVEMLVDGAGDVGTSSGLFAAIGNTAH